MRNDCLLLCFCCCLTSTASAAATTTARWGGWWLLRVGKLWRWIVDCGLLTPVRGLLLADWLTGWLACVMLWPSNKIEVVSGGGGFGKRVVVVCAKIMTQRHGL